MAIKKELKVKYDSFVGTDGKTVNKWVTVGHIHTTSDNGEYMTLERHINLAALPHGTQKNPGDIRVYVSMFDPQARDEQKKPAPVAQPLDEPLADDDIPF